MANVQDVIENQRNIEATLASRMTAFEQELRSAANKTPLQDLSQDYKNFRDLVWSVLKALRTQIQALTRHVDELDSYNRKDALLFSGIPESDNEDCTAAVLSVTNSVMKINDLTQNSIRLCHRLGSRKPTGCRPILVRFHDIRMRNTVWNEKKSLRTSTTVIHEFLTRSRQTIFAVARRHFGIKNCWTRDGVIFVKIPNNDRRRIGTMEELDQLKENHPAVILMTPTDKQQSVGKPATTGLAVATVPIRQPSNRKTSAPSRLDK
ncbi:Uncharacterized protein OBRU01_02090 [Operophtera brumata]|uniref:Uncharacterized protein n=1 Tax=Operophtera brumata TaxID=104452 RepID=A0A0L7LT08_OPEBR|nr:Uncharacterized protein OBRU01_02090 [Operophtera brumata]